MKKSIYIIAHNVFFFFKKRWTRELSTQSEKPMLQRARSFAKAANQIAGQQKSKTFVT